MTPTYIDIPASTTAAATAYVDPNECQNTGGNCTDEQLCAIWGENCGTPAAFAPSISSTSNGTN